MNMSCFSLTEKKAIVTGSRRGIGKAIALGLAEAGADVAVCDQVVKDGLLEATSEEINKLGRRSLALQANVSRKADVDNLVERVVDEFGSIDILVNNAAIAPVASLLEFSEDEWDELIDIDLKGYFLCCQAVGKKMIEGEMGNIINIASVDGLRAATQRAGYSVAKAGVVMLTRVLARELAVHNIRVNAIAPSLVKVERLETLWSNPEVLKGRLAEVPFGRIAEPCDLIGSAIFLASDASGYITGHTLVVDGGLLT